MSSIRTVSAFAFSMIFTATALAAVYYVPAKNSNEMSPIGSASDLAPLALIFGAIQGLIIGGISAGFVVGFELSVPKAIFSALIVNVLFHVAFYILYGGILDDGLVFFAPIIVSMINGAIVSFIGVGSKSLE